MNGNTQAQQINGNARGDIVQFWRGMYTMVLHLITAIARALFQADTPDMCNTARTFRHGQANDRTTQVLRQAVYTNSTPEIDWLIYAALMTDPAKRRYCLERALAINPANELAICAIQTQRRNV